MIGMLDPVTLAALGIGLMTATGFLLVAAAVEGPSSRRFVRRLQAVRSQRHARLYVDQTLRRSRHRLHGRVGHPQIRNFPVAFRE